MNTAQYRRPPFFNRPWVAGKLYDDLARKSILHCDAYIFTLEGREYLTVEWHEGGRKPIALNTWLIEPDGLTPVWDIPRASGQLMYWTKANNAAMARIHKTVLAMEDTMLTLGMGSWSRVSLRAHYVHVTETNVEKGLDVGYTPRKPYKPRARLALPDIL